MHQPKPVLKISDLSIGYSEANKKAITIKKDLTLTALSGELITLIGKNGIGKSTLLRTIANLQPPLHGSYQICGKAPDQYSRNQFAQKVSFVSTEIIRTSNLTVYDLIAFGRLPHTGWFGSLRNKDKQKVEQAIEQVGIQTLRNKPVDQLSDGERQRAMIARCLAQDTKLIILDEPTAFLDIANRYEIIYLLKTLSQEQQKTVVFSSHDIHIALKTADKIWLMSNTGIQEGAGEDLIIQNAFVNLFDSKNINFNKKHGDFEINRLQKIPIEVKFDATLDEIYKYSTNRALNRLGFYRVTSDTAFKLKVQKYDDKALWIIKNSETKDRICHSIYQLSKYLQNVTVPHR